MILANKLKKVTYLCKKMVHTTDFSRVAKGLKQGDPPSPYLCILLMEVLSCFLHRKQQYKATYPKFKLSIKKQWYAIQHP